MGLFDSVGSAINDAATFIRDDVQPIAERISRTDIDVKRSDGRIRTTITDPDERARIGQFDVADTLSNPLVLIGGGIALALLLNR